MSEVATSDEFKEHHHAHHFRDAHHEFDTAKNGMWIFLLQEVLFFAGLFVGYLVFKFIYFEDFAIASKKLSWELGFANTLVLIASSFTIARAISAAQTGKKWACIENLYFTLLCACIFMFVKTFEYAHKIHDGAVPWNFTNEIAEKAPKAETFFTFYFLMTGLHGLHVLIGIFLIIWLIIRAKKNHFGPKYFTPLEMVGLYWHFVDLVWIYLFPLLYLVG